MIISETTLADNSTSESTDRRNSLAAQAAGEIFSIAEQIQASVTTAARKGDSFDQTERAVWKAVLQIGFQAMELFVAHQGDGDLGPEVQPENGKTLFRSEQSMATVIRSVFGEHTFEQFNYSAGTRKKIELRPVSANVAAAMPVVAPDAEVFAGVLR